MPRPKSTELELVSGGFIIPEVYKKIILALEMTSSHAMAKAFRDAYSPAGSLPPVDNYKNIKGVGVSGYVYGKHYQLTRDPEPDYGWKCCALFEDDKLLFHFRFREVEKRPA